MTKMCHVCKYQPKNIEIFLHLSEEVVQWNHKKLEKSDIFALLFIHKGFY